MALPKYDELYNPLLTALQDGQVHGAKALTSEVAALLNLSAEDIAELDSNFHRSVFVNRLNWAKTYLKKAGLIDYPSRANYIITSAGKEVLTSDIQLTNAYLKAHYPSFVDFVSGNLTETSLSHDDAVFPDDTKTPEEQLDNICKTITSALADDLLTEIMQQTPAFFEQLVVDLMKAMDYGDGFKTKISNDDGIDGIIHEDKLGFNLIYIQAKR